MRRALLSALALVFISTPVAGNHEHEDEADVFDREFIGNLQPEARMNARQVIYIGAETEWLCPVRTLYFDLMVFAERYWPSEVAQYAANAAAALSFLHRDMCEGKVEPPTSPLRNDVDGTE